MEGSKVQMGIEIEKRMILLGSGIDTRCVNIQKDKGSYHKKRIVGNIFKREREMTKLMGLKGRKKLIEVEKLIKGNANGRGKMQREENLTRKCEKKW